MCKKITFLLILSLLIISCSEDNSSGPSNENGSGSQGSEIPCNTTNEGMVIKPADSETERICKDGVWEVVLSSSSSVQVVESSSSEIINIPVPVSSSANEIFSSSAEESSSSILSPGEITESSSSETGIIGQSSSSSEEFIESSSSEETKLYLCEDGETYVLDPDNCEKVSSSSVIVVSSSSDNKPISSSSDVQGSSSSEMSSSSVKQESSSSKVESSSSINSSSSSNTESSSSGESSSSSVIMSEISSSDVANSSSEIASSSSLGCIYGEDIYDTRDGKTYKTVKIGEQEWMAENLNYHYIRGTTGSARYSCYGKEEENCDVYGALYPWTVAIDSAFLDSSSGIKCGGEAFKSCSLPAKWKGVCPDGWHLPSLKEWRILVQYIGDGDGLKLKSKGYWDPEGTDDVCFSAKPAGERESYVYRALGYEAHFWTSEMFSGDYAYEIKFGQNGIGTSNMLATTYDQNSVRCIKD